MDQGSALLYHRDKDGIGSWGRVTNLEPSDENDLWLNDRYGWTVDIYYDSETGNNTAVVGCPQSNLDNDLNPISNEGAVYFFD
jgi:hypothetical protein